MAILLPVEAGGYSEYGWDATSKTPVTPLPPVNPRDEEATGSDQLSASTSPLTIAEHTQDVCDELELLLAALRSSPLVAEWSETLRQAARWHDVGKAHAAFQQGMRSANPALTGDVTTGPFWAKSGVRTRLKHGRKHFRHELASALLALQREFPFSVAYLIAAHHGKVRLSIRAMPNEPDESPGNELPTPETLFALGVYDGDPLPEVDLGGPPGATTTISEATTLDLSPMPLGGDSSWTARALSLLQELGPFRLAYLEALLRVADCRASKKEPEVERESPPDAD